MKPARRKAILPLFVILIVLFVIIKNTERNPEEHEATPIASQVAGDTVETNSYRSSKYDFILSYPKSATLHESVFSDSMNVDSWSLVEERTGKTTSQAVDCGVRYPDELYLLMSISDTQATSTNLKINAQAVQKRYTDPTYVEEIHGGKTYKVKRAIAGMCDPGTEVIWKAERENIFVVFSFPSTTEREQDYWDIIQSLTFNGNEDRTP